METVKVTVNLPEELVQRVRAFSQKKHISMTQAIRDFMENELYLRGEEEKGSKILVEKPDHSMVQLIRK